MTQQFLKPARAGRATVRFFLLFAAVACFATAGVVGQTPPKKPPEEVEETVPPKPKGVLRLDDGQESSRTAREKTARLADLAEAATRAKSTVLRDLYREFSVAHDVVIFTHGRTQKIEPFPRRVAENMPRSRETLRFKPQGEKGVRANVVEANPDEVKKVDAFEELAAGQIERLLDPKGFAQALPRREVLEAAERILAAVISYHELAREQKARQGDDWKVVEQHLRDLMVDVQAHRLSHFAQENNWPAAFDLAAQLAEAYPKRETKARFAKEMTPFVRGPLRAGDYAEVRKRLIVLQDLFPDAIPSDDLRGELESTAQDLVDKARRARQENVVEARKLALSAELVWPRLKTLQDFRMQINGDSKAGQLNVGVRRVPEFFTPDTAATDAELQAVELLFESLVKPVSEPGKGTRYFPNLAAERPRQIPLGREFQLDRDAYWSDGSRVTGAEVNASLKKWKALGDADLIDVAEIGDDAFHVSLSLRQGYLDPLSLMSFKIMPLDWKPEDRRAARDFGRKPLGSGPYALQKREPDSAYFLANFNFQRASRKGMPHIPLVRFYRPENKVADFKKQFADQRLHVLLDLPSRDVQAVRSVDPAKVNVYTLKNRRVYFLAVNQAGRSPVLNSAEARRVLAMAINRGKILDDVFRVGLTDEKQRKSTHSPLNGPFPAQSWANNPTLSKELFNPLSAPSKAKQLGLSGSSLSLKFPDDDPDVKQACERIQSDLRQHAGVELRLEPRPPAELREEVEVKHEYELAYYHIDYPDETYRLWPWLKPPKEGGKNFFGYEPDGQFQQDMKLASVYRDFNKVKFYTHRIHAKFQDEMPFIPLWQLDTHIAIHADVRTYPEPARLDPLRVFQDVERWELAPPGRR